MSSIYQYYILDICIDKPSIFTPNTYPILNISYFGLIQLRMLRVIKKKCYCPYPSPHKHPHSTMI